MSGRFDLKVSPSFIFVEITGQRAFDITRSCVMTLYQIVAIRVHQADEGSEVGCRQRVKFRPQSRGLGRYFGDEIRNGFGGGGFKPGRFDAAWCFKEIVGRSQNK